MKSLTATIPLLFMLLLQAYASETIVLDPLRKHTDHSPKRSLITPCSEETTCTSCMFNHHGCKYHKGNNSCTDNADLTNSAHVYFGIELADLCMAYQSGYCSPIETGHHEDFENG